jgi:hypothetical protein
LEHAFGFHGGVPVALNYLWWFSSVREGSLTSFEMTNTYLGVISSGSEKSFSMLRPTADLK